ncbi:MAG: flagellar brake protein [Gallionella sp.]
MDHKLQKIDLHEVPVGKPLTWSLYDQFGRLLFNEGALLESTEHIQTLCEKGLFRACSTPPIAAKKEKNKTDKPPVRQEVEELQSIKFAIGDTVQLQDFSSDKQRYFVKLIGFMNKKSVLLSHPRKGENLSFIKEGHAFLVRGFAGTKIYEFSSNVISVSLAPYPYLHLAFPAQVNTVNMRGAVRIKLKLTCSIDSSVTGLKVPATIDDMSISGARIHAVQAFGKVGDAVSVSLRMQVGDTNQVFLISSIIRNVQEEVDNQTGAKIIIHGMEFVQTMRVDLTVLQNFIYKSMLEN